MRTVEESLAPRMVRLQLMQLALDVPLSVPVCACARTHASLGYEHVRVLVVWCWRGGYGW